MIQKGQFNKELPLFILINNTPITTHTPENSRLSRHNDNGILCAQDFYVQETPDFSREMTYTETDRRVISGKPYYN